MCLKPKLVLVLGLIITRSHALCSGPPDFYSELTSVAHMSISQFRQYNDQSVPQRDVIYSTISGSLAQIVGIDGDMPWLITVVRRIAGYARTHHKQVMEMSLRLTKDQFYRNFLPQIQQILQQFLDFTDTDYVLNNLTSNFGRYYQQSLYSFNEYMDFLTNIHEDAYGKAIAINEKAVAVKTEGETDFTGFDKELLVVMSTLVKVEAERANQFKMCLESLLKKYSQNVIIIFNRVLMTGRRPHNIRMVMVTNDLFQC